MTKVSGIFKAYQTLLVTLDEKFPGCTATGYHRQKCRVVVYPTNQSIATKLIEPLCNTFNAQNSVQLIVKVFDDVAIIGSYDNAPVIWFLHCVHSLSNETESLDNCWEPTANVPAAYRIGCNFEAGVDHLATTIEYLKYIPLMPARELVDNMVSIYNQLRIRHYVDAAMLRFEQLYVPAKKNVRMSLMYEYDLLKEWAQPARDHVNNIK